MEYLCYVNTFQLYVVFLWYDMVLNVVVIYSRRDSLMSLEKVDSTMESVGFSSVCDVVCSNPAKRRLLAILRKHATNITKRKKLVHAIPTAILLQ